MTFFSLFDFCFPLIVYVALVSIVSSFTLLNNHHIAYFITLFGYLGWIYLKCMLSRWIDQANIENETMLILNILVLTLGYYTISCQKNIQNGSIFGFIILAMISSQTLDCVWHRLLLFESGMIAIKFSTGVIELVNHENLGDLSWKFSGLIEWSGLILLTSLDIFTTHSLSWPIVAFLMSIPYLFPMKSILDVPKNRLYSGTLCIPYIPTTSEIISSISKPQFYSV